MDRSTARPSERIQFAVIADESRIEALEEDWNNLYKRAERPHLSQSFEWVWCVWQTIAKPRGERPRFVVISSDNRVVLIWPMVVSRRNFFWSVAAPPGTSEYNDVLVEDCQEKHDLSALAWKILQENSGAAVIRAERVRTDSLLAHVFVKQSARRIHSALIRYVAWEGCESWESYWRSTKYRRHADYKHRKLSKQGSLSFQMGTEHERQQEIATWMLRQKTDWMSRKNLTGWVGTKEYEDFFTSISSRIKTFGQVRSFTLSLDGKVIAAQLNQITDSKLEIMNLAYDYQYSEYSPGSVLLKLALQWAHERKLDVDFRIGNEKYKEHVSNKTGECSDYIFVNNGWGNIHEYCYEIREQGIYWKNLLVKAGAEGWRSLKKVGWA